MELFSTKPFEIISQSSAKKETASKGLHWAKQDLIKYAVFLAFDLKIQTTEQENEPFSWSFFTRLAMFVQVKNPNQCRIHHKKMMKDHCSINSLMTHLKTSIPKFQEWYTSYESALNNLRICLAREKEQNQKYSTVEADKISLHNHSFGGDKDYQVEDDKKDVDLGPTDDKYDDQRQNVQKPSSFIAYHKTRPSFNACAFDEQAPIQDDYNFFNSRISEASKKTPEWASDEDKWKSCQNSFVNYMDQLNFLMNSSI